MQRDRRAVGERMRDDGRRIDPLQAVTFEFEFAHRR
jgi:hypothetical protein